MSKSGNTSRPNTGADDVPVVSMRSPGDLLATVAFCLRFHPHDSVVLLALADRRVVCAARADLPPASATAAARAAVVDAMMAAARRAGATAWAWVGYGPAAAVTPLMDHIAATPTANGQQVIEMLRVTDGRYFSYQCTDPRCCPADGVAFDTATSPVLTHAVLAGKVVLPDRRALLDSVAPITGPAGQAMRQLTDAAAGLLAEHIDRRGAPAALAAGTQRVRAALARYEHGGRLTDDEIAELVAYLRITRVRDAAWRATDDVAWQEDLWRDVTRRADPAWAAAPASLLAFVAWRRGDGALANAALDRAMQADARYPMALLLRRLLDEGVPPSAIPNWPASTAADPTT